MYDQRRGLEFGIQVTNDCLRLLELWASAAGGFMLVSIGAIFYAHDRVVGLPSFAKGFVVLLLLLELVVLVVLPFMIVDCLGIRRVHVEMLATSLADDDEHYKKATEELRNFKRDLKPKLVVAGGGTTTFLFLAIVVAALSMF